MGLFHWGLPAYLLEWVAAEGVRSAVETGTYRGDSAMAIAGALGSCITVELSEALHERATRRFDADDRVRVLHGSSAEVLPTVCASLAGPTLFWLDAHYSGGDTAGAGSQCPVLGELDAIAALPDPTQHIVLVDDARLFGFVPTAPPHRSDWPSLFTVLSRLEGMGLRTYVVDDVVVGVGPNRVASFEELFRHRDVRQHLVLHRDWTVVRLWLRWSPSAVWRRARWLAPRVVRRLRRRVRRCVR